MDAKDEISFDILEFLPEQVCENIFENLSGKDLLIASLVSTTWYDFIAMKQACMKKIKLSFTHKSCKSLTKNYNQVVEESSKLLKQSQRKYENVEFLHYQSAFKEVKEILAAPGRKWKQVEIVQIKFPRTCDCIEFLAVVEPTVESLVLNMVYIDAAYATGRKKELTFPKLKKLRVVYIQTLIFQKVFENCTSLTDFQMTAGDQNPASLKAIHKMFRGNKDLKNLAMITNIFTKYFDDDISKKISFKLTSFEIRDVYNMGDINIENIKQFIETQMSTLQTLRVGDWLGLDILKMIFHMPRLTKFIFEGFFNMRELIEWSEVDFHKLSTLETFHLIDQYGRIEILKAFLRATPNLKHLTLHTINNESLAWVSEALPNLESLTINIFEATDVSNANLFPKLTKVSAKVFHNDLEISCTDKNKPELSNFEKLVDAKMLEVNPEGRKRLPKRPCCPHDHPRMMHY